MCLLDRAYDKRHDSSWEILRYLGLSSIACGADRAQVGTENRVVSPCSQSQDPAAGQEEKENKGTSTRWGGSTFEISEVSVIFFFSSFPVFQAGLELTLYSKILPILPEPPILGRCAPPCLVDAVLEKEPRASSMLGKHSPN